MQLQIVYMKQIQGFGEAFIIVKATATMNMKKNYKFIVAKNKN
jgi:hypothetical protein